MTTYVTEREARGAGFGEVMYAGPDPHEAKRIADESRVRNRHTFIHVWEDGKHQYVTRENPAHHDRP